MVQLGTWLRRAAVQLRAAGIESAGREARILAASVLGATPVELVLATDRRLDEDECRRLERVLERRLRREPVQYITGTTEFWSLELEVTPDVLIPRPETEHVVEAVLAGLPQPRPGVQICGADLGTGSGAIALALLRERRDLHVYAVDVSEGALRVAQRNAQRWGVDERIAFFPGSWCDPLLAAGLAGRLDFVVANPPYVTVAEFSVLAPEIRDYEPEIALVSGPDGLEAYRQILVGAPQLLRAGGLLVLEVTPARAGWVASCVRDSGAFFEPEVTCDYAGRARVVAARRRAEWQGLKVGCAGCANSA